MNMFPVGQNATSSNDGNTFGSAIRDIWRKHQIIEGY